VLVVDLRIVLFPEQFSYGIRALGCSWRVFVVDLWIVPFPEQFSYGKLKFSDWIVFFVGNQSRSGRSDPIGVNRLHAIQVSRRPSRPLLPTRSTGSSWAVHTADSILRV
jgi:hypothetical protein